MEELRKLIGKNLTELRKRKGLTQIKLAEIFNYTDRAVSKWETGETLPDIEVLYSLCEFYGVTLDYLTHEDNEKYIKKTNDGLQRSNKITIAVLVISIFWVLATIIFVYSILKKDLPILWQAFIWAIPVSSVVAVIFNKMYFGRKITYFISWSVFIWGMITAIFLSFGDFTLWPLYLVGVPAQFSLLVWLNIRKLKKKQPVEE